MTLSGIKQYLFLIIMSVFGMSNSVKAECLATGESIDEAKDKFERLCKTTYNKSQGHDCDPRDDFYICSDQNVDSNTVIPNGDDPAPNDDPVASGFEASLFLIDVKTNQKLQTLKNGDRIQVQDGASYSVSVEANEKIGSVYFANSGQTENIAPYAMCGDNSGAFKGCSIGEGVLNLEVQIFSKAKLQGKLLATMSAQITFAKELAPSPPPVDNSSVIESIVLADAGSSKDIRSLKSGDVIDLSKHAAGLSIVARTKDGVGSVNFNGKHTENVIPLAMCGDNSGDLNACDLPLGAFDLTVTAYEGKNKSGALLEQKRVTLNVVKGSTPSNPEPTPPPVEECVDTSRGDFTANSSNQLVMEAESGNPSGDLKIGKNISGFTGSGFIYYKRNGKNAPTHPDHGYDASSQVVFEFSVTSGGKYSIDMRGARYNGENQITKMCGGHDNACCPRNTAENNCSQSDLNNDIYLEVVNAQGQRILSPTKTYIGVGSSLNQWKTGGRFDAGGSKSAPVVNLPSKGTYRLIATGRSTYFALDKIIMWKSGSSKPSFSAKETLSSGVEVCEEAPPAPTPTPTIGEVAISGELKRYHKVTLTFDGPQSSESASPNPFLDYRMTVNFTAPDGKLIKVPGYFAADGNAKNTSATSGNKWRAHLFPEQVGNYHYQVDFKKGSDIAINLSAVGTAHSSLHGASGELEIKASGISPSVADHRGKGRLHYVGKRYLKYNNGASFLKVGADAPEVLLGYADFDATVAGKTTLKTYSKHVNDWNSGDPTWKGSKGKGLIGAVNYLANSGMNALSFLTMNITGDGDNVWPYSSKNERYRFDVSKLDQWEAVLEHASKRGMYLHFKTQETENDSLLDRGQLGKQRKIYYRELVARFSHHPALNWNLGEEWNLGDASLIQDYSGYIRSLDPYDNHIVLHTYPGDKSNRYTPQLPYIGDHNGLSGLSLQSSPSSVYKDTIHWLKASGERWVVANDEQGSANIGVHVDGHKNDNRDQIRKEVLYGNLMAGGAGVEYYFGYGTGCSDLTCEDFRTRDSKWKDGKKALWLFKTHLPYCRMQAVDKGSSPSSYLMKDGTNVYAYYFKDVSGSKSVTLGSGEYTVQWVGTKYSSSRFNLINSGTVSGGNQTIPSPGFKGDGMLIFKKKGVADVKCN